MHNLSSDHLKATSCHEDELVCRQEYFEFNVEATPISPTASLKRKYHHFDDHHLHTQTDSPSHIKRSISSIQNEQQDKYAHQQSNTIEYVLFDENFLPVTQSNNTDHHMSTTYVQYSVASGTHPDDHHHNQQPTQNIVVDSNTDWTQVDLLDLDQRHQWYFEETPSANASSSASDSLMETSTGSVYAPISSSDGTINAVAPLNDARCKTSTDGDLFCLRPTQVVDSSEARSVAVLSKSMPSEYIANVENISINFE